MRTRNMWSLRRLIYGAVCLALCLVLPLVTGGIPVVGKTLSPMHFPVLICGFIAGPEMGALVGLLAPILRNLIFGAPSPIYPKVIRMMAELAAYGFFSGFFYRYLPKKPHGVWLSLISAMCFGRIIYGLTYFLISLFDKTYPFALELVVANTVSGTAFGILFQVILIPPIVIALQRSRLIAGQ